MRNGLGTLVVEEHAMPIIAVALRDRQVWVDAVYPGPYPGLPLGEHAYAIFDPDGGLVWRGLLPVELDPVPAGGHGRLSAAVRVESAPGAEDGRAASLQRPHPAVDDEVRLIGDAVFPAGAVFLGWRNPDGTITDTPTSLALPRLYQIG